MSVPVLTLNNGIEIPSIGFGTWQLEGNICYESCLSAIRSGYRSIDTAKAYGNEVEVGRAIKDCGIPRNDLFITTKLWNADQGYDSAMKAFDLSTENLGLEVLDLYLIHWPGFSLFSDSFKAMEKLYNDGRIRSIGVSNFLKSHLKRLMEECAIVPAVNQLESHPYLYQEEAEEYCRENSILVEAWSPLMSGKSALENESIIEIAAQCGKSAAQVILRWHIQHGRRVIPRSSNPDRAAKNIDIFDFSLSQEDMNKIDLLTSNNFRTGPHPDIFFL